jgi:hypothetical protein
MTISLSDHSPTNDTTRLFDGANFSPFGPMRADMGASGRFETPSSNTLGEDSTMFPFDNSANLKSASGQSFAQGGHITPAF